MKRIVFVFLICLFFTNFCAALEPVEGYWLSFDEKTKKASAGWELYVEGGKLYGKILSIAGYPQNSPALYCKESYQDFPLPGKVNAMPVVGTPWIFGLTKNRSGQWENGSIIDPEHGNMYKCRIIFHAALSARQYQSDTLEVRGEIGLGIGRSVFWQRCTRQEAAALR
ncbi:hypothetical protein FACS1894151_03030 [Spirochaetia bacterium]|nr:hypothetical protein FACS1894151_03030 [Spirochaetia bacterium]